jgi:hypothetical protein
MGESDFHVKGLTDGQDQPRLEDFVCAFVLLYFM